MKIFKTSHIKQIDNYTILHEPISSINLMKRASHVLSEWLIANIPAYSTIKIFAGQGNNGGDAFFVAENLIAKQFNVTVYFCHEGENISTDCQQAHKHLSKKYPKNIVGITELNHLPILSTEDWVIDGLFGSGLNRPLTGFFAEIVKHINKSNATIIAIDIPSGLMGEDNSENIAEHIICANHTLSFEFPKLAFLFPENENFVDKWNVLDIGLHPKGIEETPTNFYFTDKSFVKQHIKPRATFSHKGTYGHALIIGGSYGKMGAAILASRACLRSGVGLLTVHIPQCGYEIMQISVPEAMVSVDKSAHYFSETINIADYNSIGIGIGLGKSPETVEALKETLKMLKYPTVFDADALNILSENKDLLDYIPQNSIFTPHPKEFERLAGKSINSYERLQILIDFAKKHQIFVVLKGAYTSIADPDGNCWFNSTGNAGMATAGSGDVLCGIITGLLAQGYSPFEAAVLGTYFHGCAGDKAAEKRSQASMIAGDIIEELKI
jgi:NAD(P)H-hydrate epimerase